MAQQQSTEINALSLDVATYQWQPRGHEQWQFVRQVGAHVVVRLVIPFAVIQLELSSPVIVPSAMYVVVAKVGIIDEVAGTLVCIESTSDADVQQTQDAHGDFPYTIQLPWFETDVRFPNALDTSFDVEYEERTFLPRS